MPIIAGRRDYVEFELKLPPSYVERDAASYLFGAAVRNRYDASAQDQ